MTAIGLQSSFTLLSLSFCVLCSSDVETVRSLVEEIETDNTDEITDNSDQQGIGKRVIGEERRRINAPVHSLVILPDVLRSVICLGMIFLLLVCADNW